MFKHIRCEVRPLRINHTARSTISHDDRVNVNVPDNKIDDRIIRLIMQLAGSSYEKVVDTLNDNENDIVSTMEALKK